MNRQDPWSATRAEAAAKEGRGGMRVEEYVDRIADEMHERVEFQRRLFKQVIAGGGSVLDRPAYCPLVGCSAFQAAGRSSGNDRGVR